MPKLPEGTTDVPRRLHVSELRHGFRNLAGRLDIFLDGQLMHDVVAYDVDAGSLERYVRDESGNRIIAEAGDRCVTETLVGKVRVQLRDHA